MFNHKLHITRPARLVSIEMRRMLRLARGGERVLPSFLIIGAQKCATTSMYDYLCQHPSIDAALTKEVHFFDNNFNRGESWYRSNFPLKSHIGCRVTGEASPYYFFHPLVPARVADLLPEVNLILLLRDPVTRAYSHYQHNRRYGLERRTFDNAIKGELDRIQAEITKIRELKNYNSKFHQHFCYLSRGLYFSQLETWLSHFPEVKIHIVFYEEFVINCQDVVDGVFNFLNLTPVSIDCSRRLNPGSYGSKVMPKDNNLKGFFLEDVKQLENFVGRKVPWSF